MGHSEGIDIGDIGTELQLEYLVKQYFPVNFRFPENDKSYNRDSLP